MLFIIGSLTGGWSWPSSKGNYQGSLEGPRFNKLVDVNSMDRSMFSLSLPSSTRFLFEQTILSIQVTARAVSS